MTLRRLMMWLQTSPAAANGQLIATAVKIAVDHGAELHAIITMPKLSRSSHWAIGGMVSSMAAEVESRSARTCAELVERVNKTRTTAGLTGATVTQTLAPHTFGECVAVKGRTFDLIVAGGAADEETRSQIESLIFEVARPVLLLPSTEGRADDHAFDLRNMAIAWDGSRTAARAASDALPLLKRATEVALIRVTDDKDLTQSSTLKDLSDLLASHGVRSTAQETPGRGRPTAAALEEGFRQSGADVLVMGAYGHSRAREFVLGGATRGTLHTSPFPLLLSH